MMKCPPPDCLADGLQRLWAGGGQETVRVDVPLPHRFPCSKIEAEKVERLARKISTPVCILAVDNLCLLRMQHQLARRKAAETRVARPNPRKCRRFSHARKQRRGDRAGWLGREDSNLGIAGGLPRLRRRDVGGRNVTDDPPDLHFGRSPMRRGVSLGGGSTPNTLRPPYRCERARSSANSASTEGPEACRSSRRACSSKRLIAASSSD